MTLMRSRLQEGLRKAQLASDKKTTALLRLMSVSDRKTALLLRQMLTAERRVLEVLNGRA